MNSFHLHPMDAVCKHAAGYDQHDQTKGDHRSDKLILTCFPGHIVVTHH